jgi:hypothetical protein
MPIFVHIDSSMVIQRTLNPIGLPQKVGTGWACVEPSYRSVASASVNKTPPLRPHDRSCTGNHGLVVHRTSRQRAPHGDGGHPPAQTVSSETLNVNGFDIVMFDACVFAANAGGAHDSDLPIDVVVVVSEHLRGLFGTRNQRFESRILSR